MEFSKLLNIRIIQQNLIIKGGQYWFKNMYWYTNKQHINLCRHIYLRRIIFACYSIVEAHSDWEVALSTHFKLILDLYFSINQNTSYFINIESLQ